MKPSKVVQRACQVLRRRVRFREAALRLDSRATFDDDTAQIRAATRLYVESWIVPLLDAIERGDTQRLKDALVHARGDPAGKDCDDDEL